MRAVRIAALCALLAFLVVGVDPEDTSATADGPMQRALDAITTATFDPAAPASSFPANWRQLMGYDPVVATGPAGSPILVNPHGECSSFSGQTAYGFESVCKEHDLAYDVLRYSAKVGVPLPAASRAQADAMFRRELHGQCTSSSQPSVLTGPSLLDCHLWAESFALAVDLNSWRQGYRPPVPAESLLQWELTLALFAVLLTARLRIGQLRAEAGLRVLLRPVRRRRLVLARRRVAGASA